MMKTYAYARVSSADQNLNRQIDSFLQEGVEKQNIYCDKKSGKNFQRENYLKLIKKLKKGDLLIVTSIDRLGRNYDMIIEEWTRITKQIGADILVLDMPLLDTRVRGNDLTGKLISDIVLQLLSYVAQKERENIRARQKEGIASAKHRGVKFGRPRVSTPENFLDLVKAYKKGEITFEEISELTGLKRSTLFLKIQQIMLQLELEYELAVTRVTSSRKKSVSPAIIQNRYLDSAPLRTKRRRTWSPSTS